MSRIGSCNCCVLIRVVRVDLCNVRILNNISHGAKHFSSCLNKESPIGRADLCISVVFGMFGLIFLIVKVVRTRRRGGPVHDFDQGSLF